MKAASTVSAAMPALNALGLGPVGGYANAFRPVPADWKMEVDGLLPLRDDLDPERYADFAEDWRAHGARILGGCCGTGPAHIARLKRLLEADA